jgi:uncharacterized protein (DUF2267 family)
MASDEGAAIELTEAPYREMLAALRAEHGEEVDAHLREILRDSVHNSFKELRDSD